MRPEPRKRKPRSFWTDINNVKGEIDSFTREFGTLGEMPKEDELKAQGFGSLANAIHQRGGFKKFAADHGYETKRKANGYWDEFATVERELGNWFEANGEPG